MKIITLFILFCFSFSLLYGQSTDPRVLSSAGGFGSNATSSLSWTLGESLIETFSPVTGSLTQGFQQPFPPYRITGLLTYDNTAHTPLDSCKVYLSNMGGIKIDSATTHTNGYFYLYKPQAGNQTITARTSKLQGGMNAADALLILRHFVHSVTLQGLYLKAGDVDGSGFVNSVDALLVAKRFAGIINIFSVGNWIFSKDTVSFGTSLLTHDFNGLCYGDVNGSFIPLAKSGKKVELLQEGEQQALKGYPLILPVRAGEDFSTSAVSLVLDLPAKCFSVQNVSMPDQKGSLVWNQVGDQLRICWYSLEPLDLKINSTLFYLTLMANDIKGIASEALMPVATNESEINDEEADAYLHIDLNIPKIANTEPVDETFLSDIYPNPFQNETSFSYGLPEESQVRTQLYSLTGALVKDYGFQTQSPGTHTLTLTAYELAEGIYILKFIANGKSRSYETHKRLVISR